MRHVVVIGGGIAGASITRVLSQAGIRVTLLEKSGQLCSGSTWHAAGLVTRFAGSPKLKKLHVRSLDLLTELDEKHGGIGLHKPGSIRIIEAGNRDRYLEARQHVAMAALYDSKEFPTRLISKEEIKALHPLVNIDRVECGIHTMLDGDIDPTSLTNAVAKEAKEYGATIHFNQYVDDIKVIGPKNFLISTSKGEKYECDAVVNAAGLWSRYLSEKLHLDHPAFVIEHQYAITESIPAVVDLKKKGHNGGRLPVLRDLAGSSYIRQEGDGFLIGPYESECVVRTEIPRGPPLSFEMELFPDKLDRIEDNLLEGMKLVPCLGEVGFKRVVNGPTIWTGDSLARCGRTTIPGYYDFNSLTYGIAQSLPLAEYLGYIMLNHEQPWDASDYFDPLRYGPWANDTYSVSKIQETYTHNNKVSYGSYENRSGGRAALKSQYPLHDILSAHGAKFGPFGGSGVEVPLCFTNVKDVDFHNQQRFHDFEWTQWTNQETTHAKEHAGLSYASFSKIRVSGKDAKAFIMNVTTGGLPMTKDKDMPCKLCYATSYKGRVVTEFTMCRENAEGSSWYLVGSRDHVRQDIQWLVQNIPSGADVKIENLTDDYCVLHVFGPSSGSILGNIEPRVAGLGFMRARPIADFAGQADVNVRILRVSFTGEMGYEIHMLSSLGPRIHDILWNHQASKLGKLKHVGSATINRFRIEHGFKVRGDLDYAHYSEAGIEPFLTTKRDFIGRDDAYVPTRKFSMFTVETDPGWEYSVVGDSPIRRQCDGRVVGFTTTSTLGARSNETVALGYLYSDADLKGGLYLDTYGFQWPVNVLSKPIGEISRAVW